MWVNGVRAELAHAGRADRFIGLNPTLVVRECYNLRTPRVGRRMFGPGAEGLRRRVASVA